jgi:hypothetical protein
VRLLRPGFVTRSQLEGVVGTVALGGPAPRSPGDRQLHYAPSTPLEIVASDELEARAGEILAREEKVAVLAMRPPLRTGCVRIIVQSLPPEEKWAAIIDRLQRASGMGDDSLELSVS